MSRIIINAHRINQGLMPDLGAPARDSDFYFIPAEDPGTAVQRILELVKTRIPILGLNSFESVLVEEPAGIQSLSSSTTGPTDAQLRPSPQTRRTSLMFLDERGLFARTALTRLPVVGGWIADNLGPAVSTT